MKRRWIMAVLAVALLGSGFWVYRWWYGPAESVEVSSAAQTQTGVLGSESKLLPWQTAYFTTRYPEDLRIITTNEVVHGITAGQYLLGSVSLKQTDQLAVTVGKLGTMTLTELPAIKLRNLQAATYQSATRTFVPDGAVVFRKLAGGYETSVFWQNDGQYAAVVVSGLSTRQAELEQQLEAVVSSWQWR